MKNKTCLRGFANHFESEAIKGALPDGQNSPQKVPFSLYAEQLSGSAFTRPRHQNLKSWCYRTQPSVVHGKFSLYREQALVNAASPRTPNQLRYSPFPFKKSDWLEGLQAVACNQVANVYIYSAEQSMTDCYFYNADGDFLFVPESGELQLNTEFGQMTVKPGNIAVIPRGVKFQVINKKVRGYLLENLSHQSFELPALGAIGANGLANPHDFIYPNAHFEEEQSECFLICKYQNHLWQAPMPHSPLNVVAWRGNYAPYQYSLDRFNTINTVSFDHPDPSIFTVLTVPTTTPGLASLDFVIFPERWLVAEHSFRPPYFHRNIMSEFMGLLKGQYDAKGEGFMPGGFSIHNCMSAHGPDADTYQDAIEKPLDNERYTNTLAFMFESAEPWNVTTIADKHPAKQADYQNAWQGLDKHFNLQ